MFAELPDTDWAGLEHAYGSAEDVPAMLRGLASTDEAERKSALDEFYGAVHHQGEVYDSTVASVPFLFELAAHGGGADRGRIVELIASIGTAVDGGRESPSPCQEAKALVRGRAEEFVAWLADDDAEVRRAAANAVAGCLADAERVIALFQTRMDVEGDGECRSVLIQAAANLAAERGSWSVAQQVMGWLEQVLREGGEPETRLAAFVQLARLAPDRPADEVVDQAVELLRVVTDMPTGELFRDLEYALGEHVPGRIVLIEDQLRHPDSDRRVDALRCAGELMRGWRGSYPNLVTLIGAQLAAPEPQVRRMALLALKNKFDLAAPAADLLAERVAEFGPDAWISGDPSERRDFRDLVVALARLGDERVLPMIEAALTDDVGARVLGGALAKYRTHADRFVPTLRARLDAYADELGSDAQIGVFGLLSAVRSLGAVDTVPEVLRMLEAAARGRKRLVTEVALGTLTALGPGAAAGYDLAAAIAADEEQQGHVVLRAIEACWSLRGEADALLPLLEPRLRETDWFSDGAPADRTIVSTAAEVAAAIGPQAAPLAEHLRTLMTSADDELARVEGALALIRVVGPGAYPSAEYALEVGWETNPRVRVRIAECIRDLGAAARSFHPVLRAELAEPYRHLSSAGVTDSDEVRLDERLLAVCAEALGGE